LKRTCDKTSVNFPPPCRMPRAGRFMMHHMTSSVGTIRALRKTRGSLPRCVQMTVPQSRRNGSVHAKVPKFSGRILVCCCVSRSQAEYCSLETISETQRELPCYIQEKRFHQVVHSMNPHVRFKEETQRNSKVDSRMFGISRLANNGRRLYCKCHRRISNLDCQKR